MCLRIKLEKKKQEQKKGGNRKTREERMKRRRKKSSTEKTSGRCGFVTRFFAPEKTILVTRPLFSANTSLLSSLSRSPSKLVNSSETSHMRTRENIASNENKSSARDKEIRRTKRARQGEARNTSLMPRGLQKPIGFEVICSSPN